MIKYLKFKFLLILCLFGWSVLSAQTFTSQNPGNFNQTSTWGGSLPTPGADLIIDHAVNLNVSFEANSVTVNGPSGSFVNNVGSNTLTIVGGGSITNNGIFHFDSGTVQFLGSGTVGGTNSRTFNDVSLQDGGVDFGSLSTINGNLTINQNGFVDFGSPIYGNSSNLIYNIGGSFDRSSEWSNTVGAQGDPVNVIIQNNTQLNLGTENQGNPATISGNLFIANGSSLDMSNINPMEADLIVGGNLENDGVLSASNYSVINSSDIKVEGDFFNSNMAIVNLSAIFGNDIRFEGNFTNENGGIIFFNNRALIFEGGNTQNLIAPDNFEIPFLVIDKSGGEVVLAQDIIVSGTGGPALNMSNQAVLNLNNNQLQIGNNTDTEFSMAITSAIKGSTDSRILFNSTNSTGLNLLRFSQNASNQENYLSEFEKDGIGAVSLSDTLNILRRFILKDGTLNSDTHLTFKSSDSLTAVIPEVTGGTISGEVRVERHFPQNNRAYRYISSSVTTTSSIHANWQESAADAMTADPYTDPNFNPKPGFGTHITGEAGPIGNQNTNGLDFTPSGNPSLFTFDETDQGDPWDKVLDTKNTFLQAGDAYALLVRGDRSTTLNSNTAVGPATTLRTTGDIVTGSQSPFIDSSVSAGEFVLIGNPYQAQVDMSEILDGVNSNNFDTSYMWIWDPTIGAPNGLGGYAVVDLSDGTNMPTDFLTSLPASSSANQFLQPFQACILRADGNSPSITFVESAKRDDANQSDNIGTFSDDMASSNALEIELYRATTQTLFDAVKLRFDANYTTAPSFEDATKLWNSTEHLAIVNTNSYLSIDKRDFPQTNDTIPLYTGNFLSSQYSFKLEYSTQEDQTVKLYDHYLDQGLALQDGINTYDFNVDPNIPESIETDRFALIFNEDTLSTDGFTASDGLVLYPNPTEDQIYIEFDNQSSIETLEVECYDILGKRQLSKSLNPDQDELRLDVGALASGTYILKVTTPTAIYQHKFVKQ